MLRVVRFEELIIGGILKLERLDAVDIYLLKKWLLETHNVEVKGKTLFFTECFIEKIGEAFSLKSGVSLNTNVSLNNGTFPLRKRFEFEQGSIMAECLADLDLFNFVLRKIKHLGSFSKADLAVLFTKKELKLIKNLEQKGYVTSGWNDYSVAPYEAFEELRLTKLGEARLFIEDHKAEIEVFKEQLKLFGYNLELVEAFISKSDLSLPVELLLNKTAFDTFCGTYNISPYPEEAEEPVTYMDLPIDFAKQKDGIMQRVLTISDGHTLYITHPNSLFSPKLDLTGEELNVHWENIDFEAMLKYYNYRHFDAKSSKNALYCIRDLMTSKCRNGKTNHLVILERYLENGDDKFLVRGIVRFNGQGYAIALNPEFEKLGTVNPPTDLKSLTYRP